MGAVGDAIKQRREGLGISQNRLAKLAGIAQATLSAIENSTKSPSIETVAALAHALGCTVASLTGEGDGGYQLTVEERDLLELFRQLNSAGRAALMASAEGMLSTPGLRQVGSTASMG